MKKDSTNWLGPAFISTYLFFGMVCVRSPVECEKQVPIVVDKDCLFYEKACLLQAEGGKSVLEAIDIYVSLVRKGYYEILDILIEIYYAGIPGHVKPDQVVVESLFSMRVEADHKFRRAGITYKPRFPDAVAKNGSIVKKLRFVEVQEKARVNIADDNQNTHDTGVTGSVKATVERLRTITPKMAGEEEAIATVRTWITGGKLDKKQQSVALRVMDKIATNQEMLSSVDMSERAILTLIFNRINDPTNEQVKATLIENLVEELADSQDRQGYLYCTQGRISRMLNALNVLDAEISIKPQWAIRQEMLNEAATLKQRLTEALPEKIKRKLDKNGTFSDKFDERFRGLLKERFKLVYVKGKILAQKDLDAELAEWIDHI